MLFNSYEFLFLFLPITLGGYWLIGQQAKHRVAVSWLIGTSLFYYSWWNPSYLLLLLYSVFFNYAVGVILSRPLPYKKKKLILLFGIALNLFLIGYYKYFVFFVSNLNVLFRTEFKTEPIILPLAISFFTFQQIAFLVDAFRGETKEYNFLHYFLFVVFFPQLIAGPIVHHKEMLPQFAPNSVYRFNWGNVSVGVTMLFVGLFKKVVLADGVSHFVAPVFTAAEQGIALTFLESWIGAIAYALQLYFDFSGYSDMAIGIARMFGVVLPLNFNSPYKAVNIISFWRRWHITLSRFLRDYIYFPLGGNRKGNLRRFCNVMITMVIGGIWHGAGWTFILWGGVHGLFLVINHGWIVLKKRFVGGIPSSRFGRILSVAVTFFSVVIGWVLFRSNSVSGAINMLRAMFSPKNFSCSEIFNGHLGVLGTLIQAKNILLENILKNNILPGHSMMWILVLLFIVWAFPNTQQFMCKYGPALETYKGEIKVVRFLSFCWRPSLMYAVIIAIIATVAILHLNSVSEFLYFQF